ncbi:MAG: leucyl/phenylalanyl-tRNA--protein transferase [Pseudomonadota bacterium]
MGLTPEILMHGYSIGIFPMAEHRDDPEVFWVDPRKRGILPLDGFHMSRSLARAMRRTHFRLAINTDFESVVDGCADRAETWINADIRQVYLELHTLGHAQSVEIWDGPFLVGGVYGVTLGAAFFGESMFSRRRDASKMALAAAVERLRRTGFALFDTQFVTEHLASLGAIEVTRARYQSMLAEARQRPANFRSGVDVTLYDVMQRMTQTS